MTPLEARRLPVGQEVFCTVYGDYYGWSRVLEVRARDGYLRIEGFSAWCPPHNFMLTDPHAHALVVPPDEGLAKGRRVGCRVTAGCPLPFAHGGPCPTTNHASYPEDRVYTSRHAAED